MANRSKRGDAPEMFPPVVVEEERAPGKADNARRTTKAERREIFLPVSGFVWYYPEEMEVINHPAFQRLARVNQLGQAYFLFRGATHKRIEHSLGAVGMIDRMIRAIERNADKGQDADVTYAKKLSEPEERFIRLGALLHDIGHIAAGHTLEDELGLLDHHDMDDRLDVVFGISIKKNAATTETLAAVIDRAFDKYLPDELRGKMTPSILVRLLIRKPPQDSDPDPLNEQQKVLRESDQIRFDVAANMIGNTICADILDYLLRDWFHLGKPRPFEDRIFQYMEIRRTRADAEKANVGKASNSDNHAASRYDKFVVNLGRSPKIRTDGVSAILELLEWRYQLAETALFHRTKVAAASMLDRAFSEMWGANPSERKLTSPQLVNKVLWWSDDQLVDASLQEIETARMTASRTEKERLALAERLFESLKYRRLFKELKTWTVVELGNETKTHVRSRYSGAEGAERRIQALRMLESDFGLTAGSLAMYCVEVKPKIAQVSILVKDAILTFHEYEQRHGDILSGGHLRAQLERFDRLWRVHFFIDRDAREELRDEKLLQLLTSAIESLVLRDDPEEEKKSAALTVAYALTGMGRLKGKVVTNVLDNPVALAAAGEQTAIVKYPNGAPSVRAFVRKQTQEDEDDSGP